MRILQVIDSLSIGGAEKLIVDTVPLIEKAGNHVDILLLNGKRTAFYDEILSQNSSKIFSLGKSIYNPLYIFKLIPYLRKYDIVHVHLFPAQYFVVLAKIFSLSNVKLIFTEHSTGNRRLNSSKYKYLERFIYKFYDKIICITSEVKNVLMVNLNIQDSKLVVLENGVNFQNINNAVKYKRKSLGFTESDKLLIKVAGFRSEKDHETVVKALQSLPEDYKLLLVGDGIRRSILEELVNSLDLKHRVTFLGVRNDVYSLIKMSDIALLSSHWEGFGLVAVEAMASGIPLIASNVQGLAQVVEGGGLLFEPGNSDHLVCKVLELNDANLYQQTISNCLEKSKRYDIKLMVNKLITIYNEN